MPLPHERSQADDRIVADTRVRAMTMEDANVARIAAAEIGDYARAEFWLEHMKQIAAQEDSTVPQGASLGAERSPHHRRELRT